MLRKQVHGKGQLQQELRMETLHRATKCSQIRAEGKARCARTLNAPTGALCDASQQDAEGQRQAGAGLPVRLCSTKPAWPGAGLCRPRLPLRLAPARTTGPGAAVPTAAPNPAGTAAAAQPPRSRSCSAAVSAGTPSTAGAEAETCTE